MDASAWLMRSGQRYGPYARAEIEAWAKGGQLRNDDLVWYPGLASWVLASQLFAPPPPPIPTAATQSSATSDEVTVRRLADYERLSAIFWLVLGILQVLTVFGVIAGVWNIFAAYTRFQVVPLIRSRSPTIPAVFESLTGIIVIGIINLLLGGAIGVLFAVFDLIIRDQVLNNRHLFAGVVANQAVAA